MKTAGLKKKLVIYNGPRVIKTEHLLLFKIFSDRYKESNTVTASNDGKDAIELHVHSSV